MRNHVRNHVRNLRKGRYANAGNAEITVLFIDTNWKSIQWSEIFNVANIREYENLAKISKFTVCVM